MDFKAKLYNNLNAELEKIWTNLEKHSDLYIFQNFYWFKIWHNAYKEKNNNYELKIVVIENKGKTLAIFPFYLEKRFKLSILRWAGDIEFDYCSPILDKNFKFDKENFLIILEQTFSMLKNVDIIKFLKQPKIINKNNNPFTNFLTRYYDSKNYFISLPDKWNVYENQVLKKEFRSQNKRKKRGLKKIGKLNFKVFKEKKEISSILNNLFEQKNARLSFKKSENLFKKRDFNFYKELFKNQNENFKMHLSYLKLDKEILAMHLGAIYKKRYYYLVLSMGKNLEKYSPGRLLINLLIKWSISKKMDYFDFTFGDEDYKKSWSNSHSTYYNHVSSRTLYGFLYIIFFKAKYIIKHFDRSRIFINFLKKFKINT